MRGNRILLIRPNSSIESTPPPLGLMYIAAYLREKASGYDIRILDARIKDLTPADIEAHIREYRPDYVGITALHADSNEMHEIAGIAKRAADGCLVITGGPYVTCDYKKAVGDEKIDFCVVGEGEETFTELLECLRSGRPVDNVKGLAYRAGDGVIFTGQREPINDLDSIPHPAWDLIDLNGYFYGKKRALENPVQTFRQAAPLLSSRGCPFGCIYCHNIFGKRFRGRSPANVIDEIRLLVNKYGVKEIEFLDDTFNFSKERAVRIAELMVAEKERVLVCFSNGLRADRMDEELLVKLKRAGTYRINYGIESCSPRIQRLMGKGLDLDCADKVIRITVRHGILCGAFFMLGFPSETEEEMMGTIRFAKGSKLHTAVFSIVTPYPGTEMYYQAEKGGLNIDTVFSTVGRVTLNMSAVPDKRLDELKRMAYRGFYINPVRMLRLLAAVPRKGVLFKNFIEVIRVGFWGKELYA